MTMMLNVKCGSGGSARFFSLFACCLLLSLLVPFHGVLLVVGANAIRSGSPRNATCPLFALGDLHGDYENAVLLLKSANLIDDRLRWTGGCSTIIQMGDVIDRGERSIEIYDLFASLMEPARRAGGSVHMLIGNHDTMQILYNYRYVNPNEMARHGGVEKWRSKFSVFKGSIAQDQPVGGAYGRFILRNPTVLIRRGIVFVHAGLTPTYASLGAEGVNLCMRAVLLSGLTEEIPLIHTADGKRVPCTSDIVYDDGPVWTRQIIHEAMSGECDTLKESLSILGVNRMVVGHTVQLGGVKIYCGGRLIAIDVGNSRAMPGNECTIVEFLGANLLRLYHPERPVSPNP